MSKLNTYAAMMFALQLRDVVYKRCASIDTYDIAPDGKLKINQEDWLELPEDIIFAVLETLHEFLDDEAQGGFNG